MTLTGKKHRQKHARNYYIAENALYAHVNYFFGFLFVMRSTKLHLWFAYLLTLITQRFDFPVWALLTQVEKKNLRYLKTTTLNFDWFEFLTVSFFAKFLFLGRKFTLLTVCLMVALACYLLRRKVTLLVVFPFSLFSLVMVDDTARASFFGL